MPFTNLMPAPIDIAIGHLPDPRRDPNQLGDAKLLDVGTDESWLTFFLTFYKAFVEALRALLAVTRTNVSAAIPTTPIAAGSGGRYQVLIYQRITQAASTSSSVAVTISWTDGGSLCTLTLPAITGNTLGTTDTEVLTLDVDPPGVINYATTYASVGATPMRSKLRIHLVRLP